MTALQTIAVAFSMFSAIPMPQFVWNEKNMKYALCAFPLIGIVIGGLEVLAFWLCTLLSVPVLIKGAVLCIIPVLITGGIHLDGSCDTWDALSSHQTKERKLEIMKDPHIGSFAVIRLIIWFVLYYALWCSLPEASFIVIWLSFCLSRTLSGFAVSTFPMAKNTGLAHTFATKAAKSRVRLILLGYDILLCAAMCVFLLDGIVVFAAAHLMLLIYYLVSKKQFGGITGDLAGWFLQNCELAMLGALFILKFVEGLL